MQSNHTENVLNIIHLNPDDTTSFHFTRELGFQNIILKKGSDVDWIWTHVVWVQEGRHKNWPLVLQKLGAYLKTIKLYLLSPNVKAGFHFKNKIVQICEIEIDCWNRMR